MPSTHPTDPDHGLQVNDFWARTLMDRVDSGLQTSRAIVGYLNPEHDRRDLEQRIAELFAIDEPTLDCGPVVVWAARDVQSLVVFDQRHRTVELSRHTDVDAAVRELCAYAGWLAAAA